MWRVMRSEWVRFADPRVRWGSSLAALALVATTPLVTFAVLARRGSVMGTDGLRLGVVDFSSPEGLALYLARILPPLVMVAVVVSVWCGSTDLAYGTVRATLARAPGRLQVLLGRQVVITGFVLLQALLVTGVTAVVAVAAAPVAGVDVAGWGTAAGLAAAAQVTLRLLASVACFAAVGACLAALTRSAAGALAVAGAWGMIEGLSTLSASPWWLPGHTLVEPGPLTLLWLGLLQGLTAWVWRRRDVTE